MGSRAIARAKRQFRRKQLQLAQAAAERAAQNASELETATFGCVEIENANGPKTATWDRPVCENANGTETATLGGVNENANSSESATCESPSEPSPQLADLSPEQQVAVAALVIGGNVTQTAAEIGVDRRTIQRWMKDDPRFHGVVQGMRQELVVCGRQHLLLLAERSADMVEKMFTEEPVPRLALAFLRGIGALGGKTPAAIYQAPHVPIAEAEQSKKANEPKSATCESDPIAQTATSSPPEPLTLPQQVVLAELSVGNTIESSAKTANVKESEVRHWLHSHVEFCRQLGELQFERLETLRGRFFGLMRRAIEIVQTAVLGGDGRLALALFRGLGVLG